MTVSERKKQRKAARKARKRKLDKKRREIKPLSRAVRDRAFLKRASTWPVYGCYLNPIVFELGSGNAGIIRQNPESKEMVAMALVLDTWCLGIKECFRIEKGPIDRLEFLDRFVGQMEPMEPEDWVALMIQLEAYAAKLGFRPPLSYPKNRIFFEGIQASERVYSFGFRGRPLYRQDNESPAMAKAIVEKLERTCGSGNYHFVLKAGENHLNILADEINHLDQELALLEDEDWDDEDGDYEV